jgi:methionyl-tRNA formyltransferase
VKIVFLGTAGFGVPSLEKLCANGYTPEVIVTVPDKPAGRGQKLRVSPVKRFALEHSLPVLQPAKLKDTEFQQTILSLNSDLMIVVAFRILPPQLYRIPRLGAFNLHASLLPKYRGAAPINWAIMNGEKETGVTTFFLEEIVDTGKIILQKSLAIGENETAGEVHDRLAGLGSDLVLETVRLIERGSAGATTQAGIEATPAPKIFKEDCKIDWNRSAPEVHNFIRGISPKPGAFTHLSGKVLKIYRTELASSQGSGKPGEVIASADSLIVATSSGCIEILQLQIEGKQAMSATDFLRGTHVAKGEIFG